MTPARSISRRTSGISLCCAELEKEGHTEAVHSLFRQSLQQLARLQILGDRRLDYGKTITSREFGKQAILSDLLYFKYYFLDTLQIPYDKERLIDDFERLSTYLTQADYKYFLFRDFQSRNILLKDGQVHFIDFQGGMKGALQYDVASLLWQAKAELSDSWKDSLLDYYMDCVDELLGKKIDRVCLRRAIQWLCADPAAAGTGCVWIPGVFSSEKPIS